MSVNIDLAKVKEQIVDKYVAHYGLKPRGGLNAKVNALEKHTLEHVDPANHSAPCTNCGGTSDFNLPECPYCGDVDTEGDVPTSIPTNAVAVAEAPEPAAAASIAAAGVEVVGDSAPKPKKQKLTKVENPKKPNGANGHASMTQTTTTELVAATELDAAVVRVHDALKHGANSYYELGLALVDIFDRQLWKQRIVGGKQKHSSWALFCREELHMSHVNTFGIMDVAKAFSKEDFEEIGHTKLKLLLPLPKDRQQALAEEARKGRLPRARLKEIVAAEKPAQSASTGRKTRSAAATSAAAEKRAARKLPKPDGELTAVSQLGRTTLKMYARPNPKKAEAKPSRAVSITQDPWCEHVLVNGVVERFTVIKGTDGIKLIIERKRGG
jgi:hypothetical protein